MRNRGRIEKQGMLLRQDRHQLEEEVSLVREELQKIREENHRILEAAQALATNPGKTVALSSSGCA